MSFKFEIIESALVITDTNTGIVAEEHPKRDMYFDNKKLVQDSIVKIYDTNGVNETSSGVFEKPLSECQDPNGVTFTDATLRDFARENLGKTSGGGSGTGWDGRVDLYANLPTTLSNPAIGSIYLVEQPTTILFGAYKTRQSGLYIKDLDTGSLSDWRKLNVKVNFTDAEFALVNAADNSKRAKIDLSLLTTSTTYTYQHQGKNGIIAHLSDLKPDFNVDLDESEVSVSRVFAGGRTTFTVTHSLNTIDVKPVVFRLSDGRNIGWRIERTGVNTVDVSRNGNIANGLFRLVI